MPDPDLNAVDEPTKKKRGRPSNASRAARAGVHATEHQPVHARTRTRTRRGGQVVDQYAISRSIIPEGWDYEWKRLTVAGAGSPSYDAFMREQGWEAVPASRHPDMVAPGYEGSIIRDGLILMERPMELTQEAMDDDREAAEEAVRIKEEQLGHAGPGQFQRHRSDGSSTVKITRTVEPGTVASGMVVE